MVFSYLFPLECVNLVLMGRSGCELDGDLGNACIPLEILMDFMRIYLQLFPCGVSSSRLLMQTVIWLNFAGNNSRTIKDISNME